MFTGIGDDKNGGIVVGITPTNNLKFVHFVSFLFVTTRHLNSTYLDSIKDTMEEGEYLIIACRSFDSGLDKVYEGISIKKIPQMLLERCEFGKTDYNLNIVHPPVYDDEKEPDV